MLRGKCKLSDLKKGSGERGNNQLGCKRSQEEDGAERQRKRWSTCSGEWKSEERERGLQIIFRKFVGMIDSSHKTCGTETTLLILL